MVRQLSGIMGSQGLSSQAEGVLQEMESARTAFYIDLAQQFLDSPARWLLKSTVDQYRSEQQESLLELIREAGKFSTNLWMQRTVTECWGLLQLPSSPFSLHSPIMRLHESQRNREADNTLDGLQVGMVVHPAIVAYGNENAENYSWQPRVWMKASVWVEDAKNGRNSEANV
jgi:hypothetical protein